MPSSAGKTTAPETASPRWVRKRAEGLPTSSSPASAMAKTPISSVPPKRFLVARRIRYWWLRSPSKARTVSTICSSTRGPAIAPSLVTWPTRTTAVARFLGVADELAGRGADLADRSRSALDQVRIHGLDRIDDEQGRRRPFPQGGQDVADRRRGGELDRRSAEAEPAGAEPHLVGRLLAGNIGDREPGLGHPGRRLEQKGRLADAGIAADQGRRAGDEAAADRPVELGDSGRHALGQSDVAVEPDQLDRPAAAAQIVARREGRHHRPGILDQRVPLGAVGALAHPPVLDRAAGLADVALLGFGHGGRLARTQLRNGRGTLLSSPSMLGEGDQAKPGGGEMREPPNFPSTTPLRVAVSLPET